MRLGRLASGRLALCAATAFGAAALALPGVPSAEGGAETDGVAGTEVVGEAESVEGGVEGGVEGARAGFTGRPRWEVGVGGGWLQSFDYPGSEDPNERGLALPFAIYRGPVFRLGDGGVRAMAIERPRVQLALSIGGSLSSSTESDGVRAGMPDLDYLFELGPRLRFVLADRPAGDGGRFQASLSLAARAVASTDFEGVEGRGALGELALVVARRRVAGSRFDLIARVDAKFADDRLHEYFYEVEPRFASPERPAFDAGGGYLGAGANLGVAFRPTERVRLFAGLAHERFDGAANRDSPLFETDATTAVAVGFAWTVFRSRARVDVIDVE